MNLSIDPRSLDPEKIHLIPLGIGNAFTRNYFNTSLVLMFAGKVILIDAPAPLRRVMGDAEKSSGIALDLHHIDQVYLTHLHGDHCNGLEELGFWRMYVTDTQPKPKLHVLASLRESLWHHRLFAAMGRMDYKADDNEMTLDDYFETESYREGDRLDFGIEGFCLEPRLTNHMVETAAFRLSYRGMSLGYSSDTSFDPTLIDFLKDCDVIIHECGLGVGHTEIEELMSLPEDLRRRFYLMHINDYHDLESSPIPVLKQGALYDLAKM